MRDDLADVIRGQHAVLRDLLAELERQPAVSELILGPQLRVRERLARLIERTFLAHQAARLRHLWPALRADSAEGRTYADQAWSETRTVEALMAKRRWFGERDTTANDLDDRIASRILALMAAEERQLARIEELADRTGRDRTTWARQLNGSGPWPTRAHPDVPRSLRLASIIYRPLAVRDRVADRLAHPTE